MKLTASQISVVFAPVVASAIAVSSNNAANGLKPRGLPNAVTGYHHIKTPNNVTIRYKEPGKAGVCETTPGVNSYSGYIDLSPISHTFFWFFEARHDPENAPITVWLNGGPGSDSMIGLFQELGPCNITEELKSKVNPYSWSEHSNMLFISQPIGVGFSHSSESIGAIDSFTDVLMNATKEFTEDEGRYAVTDSPYAIDETDKAAVVTWEIVQGFYDGLGQLDSKIKSNKFSLWTESYGGHYGTSFYNYFQKQNKLIEAGKQRGRCLNFDTLGIGNGIIDARIQMPYYPEFAVNNTYGIKAINDTVYNYAKFANNMVYGCRDQIDNCMSINETFQSGTLTRNTWCAEANDMCRDNVEGPYYNYGNRGVYDIRHPYTDPTPPEHFPKYLNLGHVQQAIGVDMNYTEANDVIYNVFQDSGDWIKGQFIKDLGEIIDSGVRVVLFYGDADYICNWFGGEAVAEQVKHKSAEGFRKAGYAPFKVDGVEYGEVKEYGNFSFVRIYESGHQVPYYQPVAALELFRRAILGLTMDKGTEKTRPNLGSYGNAHATHTEPFVALPTFTAAAAELEEGADGAVPVVQRRPVHLKQEAARKIRPSKKDPTRHRGSN